MNKKKYLVASVEERIYFIRGHKVMLDTHLAELFDVELRALIQAVKRNLDRFPLDFMFQLTDAEQFALRSQFVISKKGRGGRRYAPYAFTENGVAMLSSVLKSKRAIQVNIQIMRAFGKFREMLSYHRDLQEKIKKLEKKFDRKFMIVFQAIRLLMDGPEKPTLVKGFSRGT